MSAPAFTPGPWEAEQDAVHGQLENGAWVVIALANPYQELRTAPEFANAHLIAAAPDLYDGCNAMLGLVQLILGRDDLSPELREGLTTNHRIAEAEAATAKARGESPSTQGADDGE